MCRSRLVGCRSSAAGSSPAAPSAPTDLRQHQGDDREQQRQEQPVLIAGQANELGAYWWIMSSLGMIAVVPMVVIGLYAQNWLVRGLSGGAVKG